MLKRMSLILGLLTVAPLMALAQAPGGYARVSASVKPATVKPGAHADLAVTVTIAPGFHINATKPADPDLIPTRLSFVKQHSLTLGAVRYPATKTIRESYSPKPMLVYLGEATLHVPVTVSGTAKPGRYAIKGTLSFQGCNASSCFPPHSDPVKAELVVR